MENLQKSDTLLVQQKKEWGEILTGFETKNKYVVRKPSGEELYFAAEESSFIVRNLLKSLRPYTLHVLTTQGNPVIKLKKPFRFYFHEIEVLNSNEIPLGSVRREFSVFTSQLTVMDSMGNEIYRILGPFFRPWTFKILKNDAEAGTISKKWSGLGKEIFTDADNFSVTFPPGSDKHHRAVLLGALFLIDMLYFEQK